jgi:hypothetical protein
MQASDAWDWGRQVMQHMMYVKNAEREKKAACVAEGRCVSPMADRPSSGAIPCVGGKFLFLFIECRCELLKLFLRLLD